LIKKEDGSGEEFFKERRRWREIGRCGSVKRQGRTEEKREGEGAA